MPARRARACLPARSARPSTCSTKPAQKLKELPHPSTVTGLTFDGSGKRVAASHYNGATLWFVAAKADSPRKLEWKGSHTAIAIHPDGEAVVTAMQENALHGWRLSDGQHMRMSGYPAKTESLSFTRNGKWLATSGADAMVLWPFFGGGPMGKAPIELAGGDGIICTRVAGASAAGDGGGRFRRRAGGAGRGQLLTHSADRAARARAGLRAGVEPGRQPARDRHGKGFCRDRRPVEALGAGDVTRLRRRLHHLRSAAFDGEYCERAAHLAIRQQARTSRRRRRTRSTG